MANEVTICATPEDLAESAASRFVAASLDSVAKRGVFTVALSGGRTPQATYARLAESDGVPWSAVHVFWGDERCVPMEQPDNHYCMATALLLSKVPIPEDQVHRVRGEAPDPVDAAEEYEEALRTFFADGPGRWPRLDLVILGMGADGHTASIFPGTPAFDETERLVTSHFVPRLASHRITMTLPVLNRAREVLFLVSGEEKAPALAAVLAGDQDLPAAHVHPETVRWIVDSAAATLLTASQPPAQSIGACS